MLVRAVRALALGSALYVSMAGVSGAWAHDICTVAVDAGSGRVLVQNGECDGRVTAASTFKIAISLMGFDAGILQDMHTPAWPFRPGYPDWSPAWRRTTDPASWLKNSVVWYSQQITERLGEERFRNYVQAFHYGNEDVSGDADKHDGLTRAWLSSSLKISPLEQVEFLRKLVRRELPVSAHAYDMTVALTDLQTLSNGWELHGKTGTGFPRKADGKVDVEHEYGWFVGWATKDQRTVVLARLTQDDKRESLNAGLRTRDALIEDLPPLLDLL